MCMNCPDVYDGCGEPECSPWTDKTGRARRLLFNWGDVPCAHVAAKHQANCPQRQGGECLGTECWYNE